jgi:hypothetical protein
MSAREVMHRVMEQASLRVMRLRHALGLCSSEIGANQADSYSFCSSGSSSLPALAWDHVPERAEAEELIAGRCRALGFEWIWRPEPSTWRLAPDTGRTWPSIFFGAIPYRQGNPYGDVRVAWEPSRLQHLVSLALVAQATDDAQAQRATRMLEDQFLSWTDANPPMTGIHYISAMECALRLIAVCHALDLARAGIERRDAVWTALIRLVASHARFIERRLSRHSSANNHLIAEAAGLVYAGTLFPEFARAGVWRERGLSILESEAARQILPDGGNAEQAFWYLLFVADLYGLVIRLLQHRRQPVPQALLDASQRARGFLSTLAKGPERLPAVGDSDNGYALSPLLRISWEGESHSPPRLAVFRHAGYSQVTAGEAGDVTLLFDHGPLGLPPAYGHGHADALSVQFRVEGRDVLIDPGTYTYNGATEWRSYFRSTRAHNTVTVDDSDQASQETNFIWSDPFVSELVLSEEFPGGGVQLLARHDGYRQSRGVLHWRAIIYQPPASWAIWDYLAGEGNHDLELNWHAGSGVEARSSGLTLPGETREVQMVVEGGDIVVRQGETTPPFGWRSTLYGIKEPSLVVQAKYSGPLPHEFLTRLTVGGSNHEIEAISAAIASLRKKIR